MRRPTMVTERSFPGWSLARGPVWMLGGLMVLAITLTLIPESNAYDQYSTNVTTGNCATCHGDFRASPYVSKVDGQSWNDNLHNVHRRTMLASDCEACHVAADRFPTFIGTSEGGTGLAAYGCSGCHGRAEDGTGTGTEGFGAGLRQRHWRAGATGCVSCHSDSNPVNKTPVSEKIKPPYYANPGTGHPAMPTDPCNPGPGFNENFAATTIGLDNDGNGLFDTADLACQTGTPGEAGTAPGQLLVTGYDGATRSLTISYGLACLASNNTVEYGPLSAVSTYGYSGQVCSIGNTGSASFTLPDGDVFFLIVGNDGTFEGSYGTRNNGTERPEHVGTSCPIPQSLAQRCDR